MPTLLIVDDEPNVLHALRKRLESDSLRVTTAETASRGIERVEAERPDALILDVRLPDMSGLDAFDRIRRIDPRLPVVIMTAYSTADTAIEAMKRGAFDYLIKPMDIHQLRATVDSAVELSRWRNVPAVFDVGAEGGAAAGDRIIGRSPAMHRLYKEIGRVAGQDVPVLILGESGTGKELVARALYHYGGRREGPFVAVNCAALTETLLESELFGHERGAFTGADRRRVGKFEQADRGTIFLDELGDMSPAAQAKVLRVLQDGTFERVGGGETLRVDVRIIAATNQDLDGRIQQRLFREDLLYRLSGYTIRMPPLRERAEDVPLLVEHFLKGGDPEAGAAAILPEAMRLLQAYRWPGNVRELEHAVRHAAVRAAGRVISPDCLPEKCRGESGGGLPGSGPPPELSGVADFVQRLLSEGEPDLYRRVITEVDKMVLIEVLRHVGGNQVHASQCLGISRTTLRAKISSLGLDQDS